MKISSKEIFKLSKRDLENGAVISEIYNTIKAYETLKTAVLALTDALPDCESVKAAQLHNLHTLIKNVKNGKY